MLIINVQGKIFSVAFQLWYTRMLATLGHSSDLLGSPKLLQNYGYHKQVHTMTDTQLHLLKHKTPQVKNFKFFKVI